MSAEFTCRTILVRCALPPDSVPAGRSSDKYPKPLSTNVSSIASRFSIASFTWGLSSDATHSASSLICIPAASAIETPSIVDVRAPSLSRVPWQSGHGLYVTARSTTSRICGCIDSRSFDSIEFLRCGTKPSYVLLTLLILMRSGSR